VLLHGGIGEPDGATCTGRMSSSARPRF
jgi:hypothetical protein